MSNEVRLVQRSPDDQRRYIVEKIATLNMENILPAYPDTNDWATLVGLWSASRMLVESEKAKANGG